jgi:3'-5' exoribonuclease-like protein
MTRVFYDLEFLEDGHTIELISIGMCTDDDRRYYAVNGDLDDTSRRDPDLRGGYIGKTPWDRIVEHDWLVRNVVPHLPVKGRPAATLGGVFGGKANARGVQIDHTNTTVKPRQVIANEVRDFIQAAGPDVELWAWYGAYDHVALCQLWGRMIDLPDGVPMWTNDLRQERRRLGDPGMPAQDTPEHNALEDALFNRDMARFLDRYAETMTDGPLRFSQSGWAIELEQTKDLPAYVKFKRHDATIVAGYIHPNPPGTRGPGDRG